MRIFPNVLSPGLPPYEESREGGGGPMYTVTLSKRSALALAAALPDKDRLSRKLASHLRRMANEANEENYVVLQLTLVKEHLVDFENR